VSRVGAIATIIALLSAGACTQEGAETPTTQVSRTSSSTGEITTSTAEPATTVTKGAVTETTIGHLPADELTVEAFPVPAGSHPHDVAPASDGGVWYTAQHLGELGWLDPETGETVHIPLGAGSAPHGVIVDGFGAPWITDSGLNAIVTVDPESAEVRVYPLPDERPDANLNTASFDGEGTLWFTGQTGIYGSLDPATGDIAVYDAPRGRGPYGITTTPGGDVFYASLAGSHIAAIEDDGSATVVEPPAPDQGARRVWSDSNGHIWVSEWNSGSLSRFMPQSGEWGSWRLPGDDPAAYAVYVDEADVVWVSDFGANALVRFDPATEVFTVLPLPHEPGDVRQIHGRPGEVWGAESSADHLVLIRTR
jgi:virginiamycin B lyase